MEARSGKISLPGICRATGQGLLDLLVPPSCPMCRADLRPDDAPRLCTTCRTQITDRSVVWCGACGRPLRAPADASAASCVQCAQQRFHFERVLPPLGTYRETLREAIVRMKRPRETPLIWAVGRHLAEHLEGPFEEQEIDLITSVPKHWWRRVAAQQDSPRLLAECLGRVRNIPVSPGLLKFQRMTQKQSRLTRNRRERNIHRSMKTKKKLDIRGASIAVVDDIMTTGATLNEAARVLSLAGARRIVAVVAARAKLKDDPTPPGTAGGPSL